LHAIAGKFKNEGKPFFTGNSIQSPGVSSASNAHLHIEIEIEFVNVQKAYWQILF